MVADVIASVAAASGHANGFIDVNPPGASSLGLLRLSADEHCAPLQRVDRTSTSFVPSVRGHVFIAASSSTSAGATDWDCYGSHRTQTFLMNR